MFRYPDFGWSPALSVSTVLSPTFIGKRSNFASIPGTAPSIVRLITPADVLVNVTSADWPGLIVTDVLSALTKFRNGAGFVGMAGNRGAAGWLAFGPGLITPNGAVVRAS